MQTFKTATRIDPRGRLRLENLPFAAGEEVEVTIERRATEPDWVEQLPPVTRSLLGIALGAQEEDYRRYLEEKYR